MGVMLKGLSSFAGLNFFTCVSIVLTTAITIYLFTEYAKKQLVSNDDTETQTTSVDISFWWFLGLFVSEFISQVLVEQNLDFVDAIWNIIGNIIGNTILFFICYGILGVIGVNRENKYERCKKAFMGLVIISWALLLFIDYAIRNGF
ncbi:MAG: hypothetical protein IJ862_05050 [Selenomonadaceae bacterium]|nr:hypothetical protein [Selenomonadaceae bacterium]